MHYRPNVTSEIGALELHAVHGTEIMCDVEFLLIHRFYEI